MSTATSTGRTFHVVTQRSWMVQELRAGLESAGWQVVAHHGLSALPSQVGIDPEHVLWAPQAFAARMLESGVPLRLSSPGPNWLPSLWQVDLAREVELVTADAANTAPRIGFWKLAEAKWDRFPAQWRDQEILTDDLADSGLPGDSLLHYCRSDIRPTVREFRSIVVAGEVVADSCYLAPREISRDHPDFTDPNSVVDRTARHFATTWAAEIERQAPAGPAYSLDLAYLGPQIVEANPVWCSAWYGADLPAFALAVAASQGPDVPDEFVWSPDPVLARRAHRIGPLPQDDVRTVLAGRPPAAELLPVRKQPPRKGRS